MRIMRFTGAIALTLQIGGLALADVVEKPKAWDKDVPESKADLLAIQAKLQAVLAKAKTAVVAVQSGGGAGSGVIVSEDGIVLLLTREMPPCARIAAFLVETPEVRSST